MVDEAPLRRRVPPLVTLTTDFGLRDPFVGIMKGVILSSCLDSAPGGLTHDLEHRALRGRVLSGRAG